MERQSSIRQVLCSAGLALAVLSVVVLDGCGVPGSSSPPPPTPVPTRPVGTPVVAHRTPVPIRRPRLHLPMTPAYRSFLNAVCGALSRHDSTTIVNSLPFYQYNSGVYYGTFNKSEGALVGTGIVGQWLSGGREHCFRYTPPIAGHGIAATSGWTFDGGWCLLEFDIFPNGWKIDDFTFGTRGQVLHAFFSTVPESFVFHGRV